MSIFAALGAAPSNFTVPLTEAAVAGSMGVAAGPGVDATGAAGCSSASFLPHPANRASPGRTQIAIHFLVFISTPRFKFRNPQNLTGDHHRRRPYSLRLARRHG